MSCSLTRNRSRARRRARSWPSSSIAAGFVEPRQYNPDMPASLQKVILRCLEREPGRRYPFIGMMVRELQAALYV